MLLLVAYLSLSDDRKSLVYTKTMEFPVDTNATVIITYVG